MNASGALLLDTNVLVYAHDPRQRNKQERALWVLDALIRAERAVLSAQCLSEFFSVVTRRLPEPMSPQEAMAQVDRLARSCFVLDVTAPVVLEGCRGVVQYGLPLWDALIWAVAKLNQVPVVLTEDAVHGRVLEGIRFLDPFSAAFDVTVLGSPR
jgi:predicted nucleic acid-binding protein